MIAEKRLSRYPLRDGPKGRILGFIHVKTILVDLLLGRVPDVRRETLKLPRVSQDVLLEVALRRLQRSGEHMGIVTDAKGLEVGMFTLEDIVEELIGDIHDEFEPEAPVSLHDLLPPESILLDPPITDRLELIVELVRRAVEGVEGVITRSPRRRCSPARRRCPRASRAPSPCPTRACRASSSRGRRSRAWRRASSTWPPTAAPSASCSCS